MKTIKLQGRQGDVLIVKIAKKDEGTVKRGKEVESKGGRLILAEGEGTGHHHSIPSNNAKMFEAAFGMLLVVSKLKELQHQEHGSFSLPEGEFKVLRQEEETPWGRQRVED